LLAHSDDGRVVLDGATANSIDATSKDGRIVASRITMTGDAPHAGKMFDIVMLVVPGGEERSEAQYRDLLGKAGFRLTRVVPTESVVSVVEAVPA